MGHRILIVDDEPSIVISLEYLMRREGYEVDVAADGEAALERIAESPPDLVILDVMLPATNGFEVCRRIRAEPSGHGVKIVVLTARGRESEVAKGLELGADAYMTKPFSTKDLVTHVRWLLAGAA